MALFGPPDTSNDARATQIRRCGSCKAEAVTCVHVVVHSMNLVPTGRTYTHRCQSCKAQFTTISIWRTFC
jgi:hypothetical protein